MEDRSRGDKPRMQHPETKHDDSKPLMKVKTSDLSPSSSYPSSPSSSESSLELGSNPKDQLRGLHTKFEQDLSLSPSPASSASSSPDVPNQTPQWSMISASPRGESDAPTFPDFPPEWNETNPSMMKSPPRHNHPPGYDPNRIPTSIFSSKPTNPMEWSTASNESLFSIHMGNNSFSRDQFNTMYKSGELAKSEELNNEKKSLPPSLPPLTEVASGKEVKYLESPKVVPMENYEKNIKGKTSNVDEAYPSPSTPNKSDGKFVHPFEVSHASSPRLSNESGNSSSSFVFPVLLNDAGKHGSLKAPSIKMERHQPQSQPDTQPDLQPQSPPPPQAQPKSPPKSQPESQPKAASNCWFSCFSCWPRCC